MRVLKRAASWCLVSAGTGLIVVAIARTQVYVVLLLFGFTALSAGVAFLLAEVDVLADHPDEGAERDEERRRRGAAGWQKPVSPPPPGSRPGGLPPRKGR